VEGVDPLLLHASLAEDLHVREHHDSRGRPEGDDRRYESIDFIDLKQAFISGAPTIRGAPTDRRRSIITLQEIATHEIIALLLDPTSLYIQSTI